MPENGMEISSKEIQILDEIIEELSSLQYEEDDKLDAIKRRTQMVLRNTLGDKSNYVQEVDEISFAPMVFTMGGPDTPFREAWSQGTSQLMNLLRTAKEEIVLYHSTADLYQDQDIPPGLSNKVFVVHGHDEAMRESVARTIEKLGLEPIILHEQANTGRTIIEKLTDEAEVGFAIVLLSPDDVGGKRGVAAENLRTRARQNVIMELGFFLGRLGRERVVALYKPGDNFEMPTDYSGVLYIAFKSDGDWQLKLVRELKVCGYDVDANKVV